VVFVEALGREFAPLAQKHRSLHIDQILAETKIPNYQALTMAVFALPFLAHVLLELAASPASFEQVVSMETGVFCEKSGVRQQYIVRQYGASELEAIHLALLLDRV